MIDNQNALPSYCFDRITDIPIEFLKRNGVKAIGIDLDNTTVYDSTFKIIDGVTDWLKNVSENGIKIFIITNTYRYRTKKISEKMNCPYYAKENKPEKSVYTAV